MDSRIVFIITAVLALCAFLVVMSFVTHEARTHQQIRYMVECQELGKTEQECEFLRRWFR